ncbi:MAG TPA: glycoside hydrolase family 65, partial [Blastocatellia bacterium]|nr:glycoside hydrolase family 65 [Blastocatellia bacterium]
MSESNFSRRTFLKGLAASSVLPQGEKSSAASGQRSSTRIDRKSLVSRHSPVMRGIDPLSPLSVGNGEFAFTADVTGLQTFPERYEKGMPLCTMSQWGWHSFPLRHGLDRKSLRLTQFDTYGRQVGYSVDSAGQQELYTWLRENPHRLHLGRIGLRIVSATGEEIRPEDLQDIEQQLDLWAGILTSRFSVNGLGVTVRTCVHPQIDLLAVSIESSLIADVRLSVRFAFPYGSPAMQAADWRQPARHESLEIDGTNKSIDIKRRLDDSEYRVRIEWNDRATFSKQAPHEFLLTPAKGSSRLDFVTGFFLSQPWKVLPSARNTFAETEAHWPRFWNEGGAIDLGESTDSRAPELERRIVLSQYLTAIQCSGSMPPQETGLTTNSWYGKFHLEMHWWHSAQFALWNRLHLLERSLGWYAEVLPKARELARSQGYRGARWPKMVGPEAADSPSPIGPLLI